jgi:hypothetical protein
MPTYLAIQGGEDHDQMIRQHRHDGCSIFLHFSNREVNPVNWIFNILAKLPHKKKKLTARTAEVNLDYYCVLSS